MANNKVALSDGTVLIDLSGDTVTSASHIVSGYIGHLADGTQVTGTGGGGGSAAVVVTEEPDENGGIIKEITAVDISNDSVDAAHLLSGYTAHDSSGNLVNGSYVAPVAPSGNINITQNGDNIDVAAYATASVNVSGGGSVVGSASDPVRFIDYDGTILYSYSASDFAELTAMPENPTHTGLTSQGWNWSLTDAKAQVAALGTCDIGQLYITDDGKTRIYLKMPERRLSPYLVLCPKGTVTIDWGDGSATDTLSGTSLTVAQIVQHTYPSSGAYVMTLTATSGTFAFRGTTSYASFFRLTESSSTLKSKVYLNAVQKIELGDVAIIGDYAFNAFSSLTSLTIPRSVTSIGDRAFTGCDSLTSITLPSGVTSIGTYAFYDCYSLKSISIPKSVTSIKNSAFYSCYSLTSITIPDSVTSIEINAFQYCYSLTSLIIPSGVTSIGSYAFNGCYTITSITIPDGVTSINSRTFYCCYSLTSITIPDGVTSIGAQVFYSCHGLTEIHMRPSTPPTVSNVNAWTNLSTDCIIYVPTGSLEAYTTATNYPDPNTYTYMEESA